MSPWKDIKTRLRKLRGKSDYEKWSSLDGFSQDWDQRTKQIAGLIQPGESVIEFGAGRMALKQFLPEDCAYTPSDIVDRGRGTVICDLNNSELPLFPPHDVAVFSGVLEYVNNVPRLILHLSSSVNVIIASYAVADFKKKGRRRHGWVNDFTSKQFINIFSREEFSCSALENGLLQMTMNFLD